MPKKFRILETVDVAIEDEMWIRKQKSKNYRLNILFSRSIFEIHLISQFTSLKLKQMRIKLYDYG